MKWPTVPLKEIAPAETARTQFSPDEPVWHLTLDQIESHTGYIVNKRSAPASGAGTSTYVFDEGNVLYSKLRPYLNKVLCPTEGGIATTELVPLRPRKDILDRTYLTYYLRSSHFLGFANVAVAGVKMPRIIMPKFWKHQVPLPPLSEQRRIVEILDQADALRKKRAEADAKAARILSAVFYKMFGDPLALMLSDKAVPLGQLEVDLQNGFACGEKDVEGGVPHLRMNNIDDAGVMNLDLVRTVPEDRDEERYRLQGGDVLFMGTNSEEKIGKACLFLPPDDRHYLFSNHLIRIRVRDTRITAEYLSAYLHLLWSKRFYPSIAKRWVNQASVAQNTLSRVGVPIPTRAKLKCFSESFNKLLALRSQRLQTSFLLNTIFQSLLHRAFTGDLTAKWREAHMKELLAEMEQQAKVLQCPAPETNTPKTRPKRIHGSTEGRIARDDLRQFRPAYLKILEDMERLNRLVNPSYLRVYEQMERALEPIRRQHLEISRSIELSGFSSSHLAEIVQANQRWQDLIDHATGSTRVFEDIKRTHQTWFDAIRPMQDSIAQIQAAAKFSLGDMAYRMTVTERLFAGIDFDGMRRAVALPDAAVLKFQKVIGDVTLTYEKLAASIRILPDVTYLPAFALPGATREVFITGYALDTICIPDESEVERDASVVQLIGEAEQETSACIGLLQAVDPALARPYIGAHDALRSRSADRARHVLSSLRELWNHLLHRLAPDEHVLSWIPTGDKDLLHEGRPTRRARVLYVCRSLNHEPLSDFVVQDTRALVKMVEFFNCVHELESKLTDEQLRALLLRTDSWLMYILQIWEGTK